MRTDVKIGIVVGLLILGGVVVYFSLLKGPETTPGPSPDGKVANKIEPAAPKADKKAPKTEKKAKTPPRLAKKDDTIVVPPFSEGPSISPDPVRPIHPPLATAPAIVEPPIVTPPIVTPPVAPPPIVSRGTTPPGGTDEVVTPSFGPAPRIEPPSSTPPSPGLPPRVIEEPIVAVTPPPSAGQTREYTVVEGDAGYWGIAEKMYGAGKGSQWVHIAKANPQVASTALRPGMKLKVPPLPSASTIAPPRPGMGTITPGAGATSVGEGTAGPNGSTTYVVKEGDNGLWAIAQKLYGDGSLFPVIQKANPSVKSSALRVGQRLVIPPKPTGGATAGATATTGAAPPAAGSRTPVRRPVADGRPIFIE